jgi:hypothetical protein
LPAELKRGAVVVLPILGDNHKILWFVPRHRDMEDELQHWSSTVSTPDDRDRDIAR